MINLRVLECFAEGGAVKKHRPKRTKLKPQKPAKPIILKKKSRKYRNRNLNPSLDSDSPLKRQDKSPFKKLSDSKPFSKKSIDNPTKKKVKLEENPTTQESLNRVIKTLEHHAENNSTKPDHRPLLRKMMKQVKMMVGIYPTEKQLEVIKPKY